MRVLITGASGFAGRHLLNHLKMAEPYQELHGTVVEPPAQVAMDGVQFHRLDLREGEAVNKLVQSLCPERIYHLAAQSSPRQSFAQPWDTLENNILSQLNLIRACVENRLEPRLLIISSAEIYGNSNAPLNENSPIKPTSPYGVSKVTQDMLALQYHLSHHLPILRVRPFNHFGPGQREGFVAPDFAMQVARIEAGQQQPVMQVGNLSAKRDFTDVRDVVRAYHQILEKGVPGDVYNVASGTAHSIQSMLDILRRYSTTPIDVRQDPARMLPIDVPVKCGDASHLRAVTGWQPRIPFEQSLLDLLNDCRQRVKAQ
ncbi:MAG: GDP-mannose 4,6-dehydratase [Anaerolineae bacterium]|nr:GDP-mannose 4,6-dehydratase [Anaerolineae bacterium]